MRMFPELPEWAKDAVHVDNDVVLDWKDRLRVLFGARIFVQTATFCETPPGRVESVSKATTYFPWVKVGGAVTLETKSEDALAEQPVTRP